jgi:hypothetical protein
MSNLNKLKQGKFAATIFVLSSIVAIFTTAEKAAAVPLYPNGLSNNQVYRLQMEQTAANGNPVTLNITRSYGLKNNGRLNTWMGADDDSLFVYLTNGAGINFQSNYGRSYSMNVPTLDIKPGTKLNTYQSAFVPYQDWNIEKVASSSNDTYLFHWRVDKDTNLCLDIGQGLRVNDQVPTLQYCNKNSASQRIRVIKPGTSAPVSQYTTPSGNSLVNNNAMLPGTSLKSSNQCFGLNAQSDGNLVLYNLKANRAIWNSGTYGRSVKNTVFQNDGNLVIYDSNNNAIWDTRTYGRGAKRITVQDDGNLVMYNAQNQAIWDSKTVQPCNVDAPKQTPPTQRASQVNVNNFVKAFPPGTKQITRREGNSYYPGQCVTLIVRYLQDYYKALEKYQSDPGYSNGGQTAARVAQLFPNEFSPISNTDDPIPGSIISFPNAAYSGNCNGRLCGHVALVVNSTRNGNNLQVTILDSNWNSKALQGGAFVEQRSLTIYNPPRTSTASSSDRAYGSGISWVNPKN